MIRASMRRRLILFDIDGTLLKPIGLGRRSLEAAFRDRYACEAVFAGIGFHGRTDFDIIEQGILRIKGDRADAAQIVAAYLTHLAREVDAGPSLVLPGVVELLTTLAADPSVTLGLVTGNVREGARIKLARDRIGGYFRIGAFGDDHRDRGELVRIAKERAREAGLNGFSDRDVFVIGDTRNDVAAARAANAVAVAVATGGDSMEDLASGGPDHLFRSLEPLEAVLGAFAGTGP
jgi:phosphoglycolate phosphatase-like HAD superfamily hydrolase